MKWLERRRRRIAANESAIRAHERLAVHLEAQESEVLELSEFARKQARTNHLTQLFAENHGHPRRRMS